MSDIDVAEVEIMAKETKILDLTDRRAEVAKRVGVEKNEIRAVSVQLETLRKQGILVDLSINGTSMFTRSTSWVEIGIQPEEDDVRTQRFTRGRKFLIPEEEVKKLHSVETSMRNTLDYFGQNITGFRPYRWIPFTAYDAWRERWQDLVNRFEEIKAGILEEYPSHIEALKADFTAVAEASWSSIRRQGYDWVVVNGKAYDEEGFKTLVVEDALSKLPSREYVEQNLKADYVTAMVYGLEDIEADRAQAEIAKAQAEIAKAQADVEKNKAYLEQMTIAEKKRHEEAMHRLEEEEKEAKIEAMWKAEIAHARDQLTTIVSPFEEVFTNLRNRFAQDAEDMLKSIQKNGFVRGKVAEKGRGLIDLYDLFATHDDRELRQKLSLLRQAIGADAKQRGDDAPERSTAEITTILEQIAELSSKAAEDLTAGPSRFSFIE